MGRGMPLFFTSRCAMRRDEVKWRCDRAYSKEVSGWGLQYALHSFLTTAHNKFVRSLPSPKTEKPFFSYPSSYEILRPEPLDIISFSLKTFRCTRTSVKFIVFVQISLPPSRLDTFTLHSHFPSNLFCPSLQQFSPSVSPPLSPLGGGVHWIFRISDFLRVNGLHPQLISETFPFEHTQSHFGYWVAFLSKKETRRNSQIKTVEVHRHEHHILKRTNDNTLAQNSSNN